MIYVYDPEIRFEDTEAKRIEDGRSSLFEVAYRGQIINPEKIRITGITYGKRWIWCLSTKSSKYFSIQS